jgi:hypothetical protein
VFVSSLGLFRVLVVVSGSVLGECYVVGVIAQELVRDLVY